MAAHLILKAEALAERRTRDGLAKDQDLAARMGISAATVSRVLNGKGKPGPTFIGSLVAAFPGTSIDELFEVRPDEVA